MKNFSTHLQAKNKRAWFLPFIFIVATLSSYTVLADDDDDDDDDDYSRSSVRYANVTSVRAIYETVERRVPRETCWTETVRERRSSHSSSTPSLVGGIIGGVIGNEVGHGRSNKKVGAVVGSILGMSIANDIQRHHRRHHHAPRTARYRDVERCETRHSVETEELLSGYDVRYRYHGKSYTTFMDKHPGDKIRVAVQVRPLD